MKDPSKTSFNRDLLEYLLFIFALFLTYLTSLYSYLLFHSIAEFFSLIISGGIFILGWNTRKYIKNSFFLVLGISFLFIGVIDLTHTLAFSEMGLIPSSDTNLIIQLWISARYVQAISVIFALSVIRKKIPTIFLLAFYGFVDFIIFSWIFLGQFPIMYVEGIGHTGFKILSDYIIIIILCIALGFLIALRREFSKKIMVYLIIFITSTILSEFSFIFYGSGFDFSNFLGHLFKILGFYLVYKAIIQIGLEDPFQLMFRKIKTSEESLKKQTESLKQAYTESDQIFNASLPLRIVNPEFEITSVNNTFCKTFNIEPIDIIDKKCYELFHHDFCQTEKCAMNQIKNFGGTVEYEIELKSKSNESVHLIVNSAPYKNAKGEFEGIIQNYTDVTNLKNIERKLRQAQSRLNFLVSSNPAVIYTKKPVGNYPLTFISENIKELTGYSAHEFINDTNFWKAHICDEDKNRIDNEIEILFEKKIVNLEYRFQFVDGTYHWIKDYAKLIKDKSGNANEIIGYWIDITEEKKTLEKIEDIARFPSENPNPVMRVSQEFILLANKASQEIFKIDSGSRIPRILINQINDVFSEKKEREFKIRIEDRIISLFISPIEGTNYANIYGMDITTREKALQDLERFVSTVSHELRTSIAVLVSSIDFLKNHSEKITEEVNKQININIEKNVYLLKDLIEDILMLSRIDERKIEIEWEQYRPYELIEDIQLEMQPIAKQKDVKFEVHLDKDLTLYGDSRRMDQVFRIFIDNAIKYSNLRGEITIRAIENYQGIYNKERREGVLFQIIDHGIGISKEDLPKIFDRFYRSEQVTDIPGTGLGLSIAQELVKMHEGDLFVESNLGEGSTFSIFLPKILDKKENN